MYGENKEEDIKVDGIEYWNLLRSGIGCKLTQSNCQEQKLRIVPLCERRKQVFNPIY